MAFCCVLHSLLDQAKYGARHSNRTRCCGYFNLKKIFSYEQDNVGKAIPRSGRDEGHQWLHGWTLLINS